MRPFTLAAQWDANGKPMPAIWTFADHLRDLGACLQAVEWVGDATLETAWTTCRRADWLVWLAGRVGVDRRLIVRALVDMIRAEPSGAAVEHACNAAIRWCDGELSLDDLDTVIAHVRLWRTTAIEDDALYTLLLCGVHLPEVAAAVASDVAVGIGATLGADRVRARIPFEAVLTAWEATCASS